MDSDDPDFIVHGPKRQKAFVIDLARVYESVCSGFLEGLFGIPKHPYEDYTAVGSVAAGILVALFRAHETPAPSA